jgi:DHA2 family multidrug resistance protein-like MFS transporter
LSIASERHKSNQEEGEDMTASDVASAGRREWTGLAVIALPCLLYSMDLEALYLAMPSLTADLEPSNSQLL